MEILNANSATLCNYEVMKHLQKIKDNRKKNKGQLATITYETLRYLENTSCIEESPRKITAFLKDLERYNLNKNEKLMFINTPPTTPLEIQLMVEESEERLTEEQVGEILEIVLKYFPKKEENTEDPNQTE